MTNSLGRLIAALPGLFAVATLPISILLFLFAGWQAGLAALVVGWLLLVPLSGVLADDVFGAGASGGAKQAVEREIEREIEQAIDQRSGSTATDDSTQDEDPLETLRDRYARGEIDEREFERRLEALLETEDGDAARALERLRRSGPNEGGGDRSTGADDASVSASADDPDRDRTLEEERR